MSRYQMYWQVYFHPVTRSSEIILRHILKRAKALHHEGYAFQFLLEPLPALFEGRLTMAEYLMLDESFMQMTLMRWTMEKDEILADLCDRFLNRKLFKYVELESQAEELVDLVRRDMVKAGLDPDYYLEIDFPSDLPYDVYQPGKMTGKAPILLLSDSGQIREISEKSEVVRSISGVHKGNYKLYYPREWLLERSACLSNETRSLLNLGP
jgi:hypothetical protein